MRIQGSSRSAVQRLTLDRNSSARAALAAAGENGRRLTQRPKAVCRSGSQCRSRRRSCRRPAGRSRLGGTVAGGRRERNGRTPRPPRSDGGGNQPTTRPQRREEAGPRVVCSDHRDRHRQTAGAPLSTQKLSVVGHMPWRPRSLRFAPTITNNAGSPRVAQLRTRRGGRARASPGAAGARAPISISGVRAWTVRSSCRPPPLVGVAPSLRPLEPIALHEGLASELAVHLAQQPVTIRTIWPIAARS